MKNGAEDPGGLDCGGKTISRESRGSSQSTTVHLGFHEACLG
jgi:hypothetical protein